MKIAYASDVHIEFGQIEICNEKNADLLILAGDIIVSNTLFDKGEKHYLDGKEFRVHLNDRYHDFFQQACDEFKDVIYIMGNHEYYNSDFATTINRIKEKFSYLPNLHILEKEKLILNDVTFLCGTMWTDFNKNDDYAMHLIKKRMNDFRIIRNNDNTFTPQDAYKEHQEFLQFIIPELEKEENKKVVMVTHHCPSYICIPEKYKGDTVMNPGYVSNLEDFILDNPKITHWICGHSHLVLEGMIGPTNILMNCRGYDGMEYISDTFELKYFDV